MSACHLSIHYCFFYIIFIFYLDFKPRNHPDLTSDPGKKLCYFFHQREAFYQKVLFKSGLYFDYSE